MTASAGGRPRVAANGADIPAIGLGTWELRGRTCEQAIHTALAAGGRHFDTAAMYENEVEVGTAIRETDVPRDEIFLTTKVWQDNAGYDDLLRSVEASLTRLGLDRVDLVLMHWPDPTTPLAETMRALGEAQARGLTRHIGVSNFTVRLLREAVACSSAPVAVNQVEYHPFIDQSAVLATCRELGVALTAYAPLAKGRVFQDPVLGEIAAAHGVKAGQVAIRWLIQQDGVIAIPRSAKPERIAEFFAAADLVLTEDEMHRISALAESRGRIVDFAFAPQWD